MGYCSWGYKELDSTERLSIQAQSLVYDKHFTNLSYLSMNQLAAGVAVTNAVDLMTLPTEIHFLIVLKTEYSRSMFGRVQFLVRALFLADKWLPSAVSYMGQRERERERQRETVKEGPCISSWHPDNQK